MTEEDIKTLEENSKSTSLLMFSECVANQIHLANLVNRYRKALLRAYNELGVPQYPAPVANASDIIAKALRIIP